MIEAPVPAPDPQLSKRIRMLEKRLKKYEATRAEKQAKKIERLMGFVTKANAIYTENNGDPHVQWKVAVLWMDVLRELRYTDVEAVVCSPVNDPNAISDKGIRGIAAVRVGSLYLDFLCKTIRQSGRWTINYDGGEDTVEAVIALEELAKEINRSV